MAESSVSPSELPPEVEAAFAALARYDQGSPRGDLVPLDEAAKRSLGEAEAMTLFEARLVQVLQSDAPLPAREYVCRKLILLGSARCVPALAPLLEATDLADAARSVLEVLPCDEAAAALRGSLAKLKGTALAGAVTSLGARHDQAGVPLLLPLLRHADPQVVGAVIVALGRIGGTEAVGALREWQPEAPAAVRHLVTDALGAGEAKSDGKG